MLTTTTMRMMVMMSQGYVKYSAESKPARTKKTHSYFPVIPAHNIHHQGHEDRDDEDNDDDADMGNGSGDDDGGYCSGGSEINGY